MSSGCWWAPAPGSRTAHPSVPSRDGRAAQLPPPGSPCPPCPWFRSWPLSALPAFGWSPVMPMPLGSWAGCQARDTGQPAVLSYPDTSPGIGWVLGCDGQHFCIRGCGVSRQAAGLRTPLLPTAPPLLPQRLPILRWYLAMAPAPSEAVCEAPPSRCLRPAPCAPWLSLPFSCLIGTKNS